MKRLLGVFAFLLLITLLVACSDGASKEEATTDDESIEGKSEDTNSSDPFDITGTGELSILSLGGSYQEALSDHWFMPFQEESGIKIIESSGFNYAKIKTSVESGNTDVDILDVNQDILINLKEADLLEKIDWDKIPEEYVAGIPEELRDDYAIPNVQWAMLMVYNSETYPEGSAPETWADFWDVEKFPGKRTTIGITRPPIEQAALAMNGGDLDNLYPFDLKEAFEKIKDIKDDFIFSDGWAAVVQNIATGEADMAIMSNGRPIPLIEDGLPIEVNWNEHLRYPQYFVIPKGAKNAENAQKFLTYVSNPEVLARIAEPTTFGPVNMDAYEYIDPEIQKLLPGNPETVDLGRDGDTAWIAERRDEINDLWNAVLIGQ